MHVSYHHEISNHQIPKEAFQNLHKWRQNFRLPHEPLGSYWHRPRGFLALLVLSAFSAASHSSLDLLAPPLFLTVRGISKRLRRSKSFIPTTVFAQSPALGSKQLCAAMLFLNLEWILYHLLIFPKPCLQFIIIALSTSLHYVVLMDRSFPTVYRVSKLEIHALLNYQEDKKKVYILSVITQVTNSITRNEIIIVRTL